MVITSSDLGIMRFPLDSLATIFSMFFCIVCGMKYWSSDFWRDLEMAKSLTQRRFGMWSSSFLEFKMAPHFVPGIGWWDNLQDPHFKTMISGFNCPLNQAIDFWMPGSEVPYPGVRKEEHVLQAHVGADRLRLRDVRRRASGFLWRVIFPFGILGKPI